MKTVASNVLRSMVVVAAIVVAAWLVLGFFGIHFALASSLVLSLVLTAALSLGSHAFRRMKS